MKERLDLCWDGLTWLRFSSFVSSGGTDCFQAERHWPNPHALISMWLVTWAYYSELFPGMLGFRANQGLTLVVSCLKNHFVPRRVRGQPFSPVNTNQIQKSMISSLILVPSAFPFIFQDSRQVRKYDRFEVKWWKQGVHDLRFVFSCYLVALNL